MVARFLWILFDLCRLSFWGGFALFFAFLGGWMVVLAFGPSTMMETWEFAFQISKVVPGFQWAPVILPVACLLIAWGAWREIR